MNKDKGGRPRVFQGKKTKRLGIVLPVDMYKKIQHEVIDSDIHGTMSEIVNAALEFYFEAQEKKGPS